MIGSDLRRGLGLLLAAALLVPGVALADPSAGDKAAAQGLFDQAKKLLASGNAVEACPKLEESQRLDPGIGTQFNLADCYQQVGKTASAWSTFLEVAAAARASGQQDRERVARKRATALEGKLSTLKIAVPGRDRVQGLEIRRDGVVVGRAQWDTAVPVDPGQHGISATAPGRKKWESGTSVRADGAAEVISLPAELEKAEEPAAAPAVAPEAAPVAEPGAAAAPAPSSAPAPGAPASTRPRSRQRTVGIIVAGAGVVGVGVGAVFGGLSMAAKGDADEHCTGKLCDADGVALREDAIQRGTISTIAFAVGGAALIGGVVLVLTAPSGPTKASVGLGPSGLTARGVW